MGNHRYELVQVVFFFFFQKRNQACKAIECLAQSGTLVEVGSGPGSPVSPTLFPPPQLFLEASHGQDFAYISSQPYWDQSLLLPIYFGALFLWQ